MLAKEKKRAVWTLAFVLVVAGSLAALAQPHPGLAQNSAATPTTTHLMIFAGDSIMAGYGATTGQSVVNQLGKLRPYWRIRNYSIYGSSVSGCPTRAAMNANDIVPLLGSFRFYDARHSFVTRLAENPAVSEETIRQLAGHVSTRMLSRYSHVQAQARRDAIATLEPAVEPDRADFEGQSPQKSPQSANEGNPLLN